MVQVAIGFRVGVRFKLEMELGFKLGLQSGF